MNKKVILFTIFGVIITLVAVLLYYFYFTNKHETPQEIKELNISFEEKTLDCERNPSTGHSVVGGAVIDVDNDGVSEFFITGGRGELDCLFKFKDGELKNIIEDTNISRTEASFGAFSIDIDEDGLVDLLVARESGVYLYINKTINEKIFFTEKLLYENKKNSQSIPIDISLSDTDNDGDLDIYISTFVKYESFKNANFNGIEAKQNNIFLENANNLVFRDITESANLLFKENTFSSTFVDLNNDNLEDLILILNANKIHIYKNLGNNKFEKATILGDYGFWMGLAVADVDADGNLDLFFSNIGSTIPSRLARGNLTKDQVLVSEFALWKNNGDFTFNNILPEISTNDHGFGWGIVPFDLNFDNIEDFLIRQNYVSWTPHKFKKLPGSVLININGTLTEAINGSNLSSEVYGFTTLVGDFNGDNSKDIVYLNLKSPHMFYKNTSSSGKQKISVNLPMTADYINAKVELLFKDGTSIKKHINRKQGVLSVQDSKVTFYYLGKTPSKIIVTSVKGEIREIQKIYKNQTNYSL